MSWHIPARVVQSSDEIDAQVEAFIEEQRAKNPGVFAALTDKDVYAQISAAAGAARSVCESGAVGDAPWSVMLAGHCNPGNQPRAGWANDAVQVNVSQHRG